MADDRQRHARLPVALDGGPDRRLVADPGELVEDAVVRGVAHVGEALVERLPVEGQRGVPGRRLAETVQPSRAIGGQADRYRGHHLEPVQGLARLLPPGADPGYDLVADVAGGAHPEGDAVGQLAGQLQHPGAEGRDVDRQLRPAGRRIGGPGGEVLALEGDGALGHQRADDGQVFPHRLHRVLQSEAPHALDRHLVADADPEPETAAGEFVEGERHLGHRGRVAQVDRQDSGAEPYPRGGGRVGCQDERGLAGRRELARPDRVITESFCQPRAFH